MRILVPVVARASSQRKVDNTLARAFSWKRMLEAGEFTTIAELADREGIALSYMTRVPRLALLTPVIVEAILDGRQGLEVTLATLMEPFAAAWEAQRVKNLASPSHG